MVLLRFSINGLKSRFLTIIDGINFTLTLIQKERGARRRYKTAFFVLFFETGIPATGIPTTSILATRTSGTETSAKIGIAS